MGPTNSHTHQHQVERPKRYINENPTILENIAPTDSWQYYQLALWRLYLSAHDKYAKSWPLTHWGRVTHICVSKLIIIGSDNGLPPGRRQAIIWTNAGILLIGSLGTNFSQILIVIYTLSFKKIHLKVSSGKWRPFCLGLTVFKSPVTRAARFGLVWPRYQNRDLSSGPKLN